MDRPEIYPHQYADNAPDNEAWYEFTSASGGGHITLVERDGKIFVDLSRLDDTVEVRVSEEPRLPRQ